MLMSANLIGNHGIYLKPSWAMAAGIVVMCLHVHIV